MQFISPNELLTALPPVIYERLGPHLQRVRLEAGRILFDVGATIDYTWFIKSGIVSLFLDTENGDSIEVAMAGHNSVIGFLEIVTKNEALFRAQVQIAGEALRISARDLQAAIKQESQIYLPLFGHPHILNKQVVQAVACHHFHNIDQRLARWLLLVRDRTRVQYHARGDSAYTGCFAQWRQLGSGTTTNEGIDPLCPRPDHPSRSWRA